MEKLQRMYNEVLQILQLIYQSFTFLHIFSLPNLSHTQLLISHLKVR